MRHDRKRTTLLMSMLTCSAVISADAIARGGQSCESLVEVARLAAPTGEGLRLTGVAAIAPDDIWTVGYYWTAAARFTVALHYDGANWTIIPSPSPGGNAGLNAIAAVASNDVWAAGDYERDGASAKDTLVLHWDGFTWEVVSSPGVSAFGEQGFSFEAVEAIAPDDVWFTGTRGDRALGAFTAHWDGSAFTVHTTPTVFNHWHEMVGMSALGSTDVWGVGGTATIRSGGFVMRWNGSQWNTVLAPDFNGPRRYFYDVAAFTPSDVWVVGLEYFIDDDNTYRPRPYFVHWDGSSWTEAAAPAFAVQLKAFSAVDIYGISGRTLVHWDGNAWSTVGQMMPEGILNNLVALDGFDSCSLHISGQIETGPGELAGWIVQTSGPMAGDIDGDGDVDLDDRDMFIGVLLGTITETDRVAACDLNDDGVTDGLDVRAFLSALLAGGS